MGFWPWLAATDHRRRLPGVDRAVMLVAALGLSAAVWTSHGARLSAVVATLTVVPLSVSLAVDWLDWRDGMWQ